MKALGFFFIFVLLSFITFYIIMISSGSTASSEDFIMAGVFTVSLQLSALTSIIIAQKQKKK